MLHFIKTKQIKNVIFNSLNKRSTHDTLRRNSCYCDKATKSKILVESLQLIYIEMAAYGYYRK